MDQPKSIQIDLNKIESSKCESCGNQTWQPALIIKVVSKILIAAQNDEIKQIPTLICSKCQRPHPHEQIPKP
jgi:hypothetical protein